MLRGLDIEVISSEYFNDTIESRLTKDVRETPF